MFEDLDDRILDARAAGKSVAAIAHEFGLPLAEVEASLKTSLDYLQSGDGLRESVGLALYRLERMELKYHQIAMQAADGDPACAMIALKSNERRAVLSGSTPPTGFALRMMVEAAPPALTSTEETMAVLDSLLGIGKRERELENKEMHREPMTVEEIEELEGYRRDREARQDAEREHSRAERAARLADRRENPN